MVRRSVQARLHASTWDVKIEFITSVVKRDPARQYLAVRHAIAAKSDFLRCKQSTFAWPRKCLSGVGMLDSPLDAQLERYMNLLSARQNLVASNIANADTPGYRTQDIDFQSEFQNAMGGPPRVQQVGGLPVKNDGNDVNLDAQARLLSENALRFSVASNLMRSEIQSLHSAIKEGA
jgi:flagellar basal-body rod protein FlgB